MKSSRAGNSAARAARRFEAAYRSAGLTSSAGLVMNTRLVLTSDTTKVMACRAVPTAASQALGMVHGVPDAAESTNHPSRRQVDAVLFDFHGTLAQVEEPVTWVVAAAA